MTVGAINWRLTSLKGNQDFVQTDAVESILRNLNSQVPYFLKEFGKSRLKVVL
jgi:hypothetical protein